MAAPALMLAMPSSQIADDVEKALDILVDRGWSFELKYDGVRCAAVRPADGSPLRLYSRTGQDITDRFPEVVDSLQLRPDSAFDGELVAHDLQFNTIARRVQARSAPLIRRYAQEHPAHFVAFDVLALGWGPQGRPLQWVRREILTCAHQGGLRGITIPHIAPQSQDGRAMWEFVKDNGLEGLIAKHPKAKYEPRRSPAWIKLKTVRTLSAVVVGAEPGEGSRAGTVGALRLALVGDDGPVEIGKVGTGMTERDLRELGQLLREGKPFVVDVQHAGVTPDGRLRFPSYRGLRTDVEPIACSLSQLTDTGKDQ